VTVKGIDTPSRLDTDAANRILESARDISELSQRLDRFSGDLLGRAYQEGSLGGGPAIEEEFRIDLQVFDCVTFIEVVLAFALADSTSDFIDKTRRIRYDQGHVDWFHRNHYMVDWARNNERSGFVRNVTSGQLTAEKTCTLSLIEGLETKTTRFRYFPSEVLAANPSIVEDGDIILFVSTRETLDVFHTGFGFNWRGRIVLRHATRRAGLVVDQYLDEFMSQNQLAGIVLLRPLCRR
jgi:N-acetylmuramoyl-L-alanine amidase-like protein